MIKVDWSKIGCCPECGSVSIDTESEDKIAKNYYIYCLDCRYQSETATGSKDESNQEVADKAIENWLK